MCLGPVPPKVNHCHSLENFKTVLVSPRLHSESLITNALILHFLAFLYICTRVLFLCYSRVKDLKSSQVVGCITEKVQECIARVGLHFRDGLVPWNLWYNETTVGQKQFKC